MTTIAFGTDGIRGPAGQFPIVPEVAHRIGRAAVKLARRTAGEDGPPTVVIGRDPRPSGVALARAVAAGVVDGGGLPRDGGIAPTSAIQLAVDGGIGRVGVMLTASHNPASDNGFKLIGPGGRKPDDPTCAEVEIWLTEPAPPERTGRVDDVSAEVRERWLTRVVDAAGDLGTLRGRRIAIDLANGALMAYRDAIASVIPAEVSWLGTAGDVNDGCGSEHLDHLAAKVRDASLGGGFAVDGDADRCRIVDERAREVPGDAVAWRLAVDRGVRGLAVTVMSNGALERQLTGVQVVRTAVGDRFLREAMDRDGLELGAEESGHVLFGGVAGGDGLLTGLTTLAAAWRAAGTLSDGFAGYTPLPRRITKVAARTRVPIDEAVAVQRARAAGLERLGPSGRVFLRYSGTEPVLRILVEGEPSATVDAVSAAVTSAASRALS